MRCYLYGTIQVNSDTPTMLTAKGNYLILENQEGEKFAVQLEKSKPDRSIVAKEVIPFKDLSAEETNSLYELIEE